MQSQIRRAQNVAGHIAQRAAAEIVEAAPVERLIKVAVLGGISFAARCVRPFFGDAQPDVPLECARSRVRRRNMRETLWPDRTVGPGVHFGDVADLAGPDHFGALPRTFVRIALIAHLRGDLIFVRRLHQLPRFPHRARERFLHINVLAALHAPHGCGSVHEIRNGHDDGVDIVGLFVEHLAEVFVFGGLFVLFEGCSGMLFVHIAERDDVLRSAAIDVACGLASGADRGDVEFFVGRFITRRLQRRNAAKSRQGNRAGQQRAEKEMPSGAIVCQGRTSLLCSCARLEIIRRRLGRCGKRAAGSMGGGHASDAAFTRWPVWFMIRNDEPVSYRNRDPGALGNLWRPVSRSEPRECDAVVPRLGGRHEAARRRRA